MYSLVFFNLLYLLFNSQLFLLGKVLQAMDRNKATFLDVLIECDQKTVVSNAAVSQEQPLTCPALPNQFNDIFRSNHISMNCGGEG